MRVRKSFYFLFFSSLAVNAANNTDNIHNQKSVISPIIVKAKTPLSSSLTSGPKTIVTQTQFDSAGVTTLAQALQNVGGLQLQDLTGNNSQVSLSMRGFGSNASSNTLMLINGIPLSNPDMAPPDLNSIPLSEIQAIEIIAGSESVLYGDQAVGGVVNVITKQQAKEKFLLSCNAGSYNQRNCYATFNHHKKSINFNVTADTNYTDNYRDHNNFKQNIILGNLNYLYQRGDLAFHYKLANENMQFPGALTAMQVEQNRRQANNNTDFFTDWNVFLHLKHQHWLTDKWLLQTDLSGRQMRGNGVLSFPFNQSRNIYYLKPQITGDVKNIKLTSGIDLESDYYYLGSDAFLPTKNKQQKYGIFAIANLPLYQKLSLAIGARGAQQNSYFQSYTDSNNINRALASTLGITYDYQPDIQFYLRRAGSFRFPKADENSMLASGVAALKTQRGIAYEGGAQMEGEKYSAKLGVFQLNLRDEIAFDPTQTPQDPFGSNVNLSPTVRHGLSLSGKTELTKKISLDGQYNYVNARFQNGIYSGNRIPLVSENIFHGGINYHFADYFSAYAEAVYTGNQFPANDFANVAGIIGGYTLYNFNLHYAYKNITASFRINNIFNKAYYFYTIYQSSMPMESFYPAPERNFTLTLGLVI
jgi:iron complex outermembrane receptor protein